MLLDVLVIVLALVIFGLLAGLIGGSEYRRPPMPPTFPY